MTEKNLVCVTGLGIESSSISDCNSLLESLSLGIKQAKCKLKDKPAPKGFRYKDRATKLAAHASEAALLDAGLPVASSEQICPETFGLVASSNLGNLDTVCRVSETIRSSHVNKTSPIDIPNLSSNVVATSLAIKFGFKAVNLMLCNGSISGIDALHLAANSIRTNRASRMLVVGVEPLNSVVEKIMYNSHSASTSSDDNLFQLNLGEASGAVVLESYEAATQRNAFIYGYLTGYGYGHKYDIKESILSAAKNNLSSLDLWLTPNCSYEETSKHVQQTLVSLGEDAPIATFDLGTILGEIYGALGIIQCISACLWLQKHQKHRVVATSGTTWGDGSASIMIERF
ncbi:MAG: hypothetical protein RLZZ04_1897 [Cyanobacteriota bacterium]|jgi:3-oxoacyl-[acyl-carrier-protein] synthase II